MSLPILPLAAAAVLLASAAGASAAPPVRLSVTRSIEIAAPPSKVWAVMGDFGDMSYLAAAVERTEIVKGVNNRIGAQRRIDLKDGGAVLETLTARRPYQVSYRMDESGLPVTDYTSTLRVAAAGAGSKLTWSGQFRSRPAGNVAGADADQTAIDTIAGIYEGGLVAIKTAAER